MAEEPHDEPRDSRASESTVVYPYSPLINSRDIRLIRFLKSEPPSCKFLQISLDQAPLYVALSYTWGTGLPKHIIQIDGHDLTVSENLYTALEILQRSLGIQYLWVDAICINQTDLAERSHQVGLMNAIYRSADRVIVWLGPEADDSGFAMETIQSWRKEIFQREENTKKTYDETVSGITPSDLMFYGPPGTTADRAWLAIRNLWERSWWRRAWIVQEATLSASPHLLLMCGDRTISWDDFAVCVDIAEYLGAFDVFQAAENWLQSFPTRLHAFRLDREDGYYMRLLRVLEHMRSYECSDDRDKVFAALGMVADVGIGDFKPDYEKSVQDIYIEVVRFILGSSELHCLNFLGHIVRPDWGAEFWVQYKDMPTWVPDWRTQISCAAIEKQQDSDQPNSGGLFHASGQSQAEIRIDGRRLIVKGLCIDAVKSVSSICDENRSESGMAIEKKWREEMPQQGYITGESVRDAFDRVIVTDVVQEDQPHDNLYRRNHHVDWDLLERDPHSLNEEERRERHLLEITIKRTTFGRRIFWTDRGYLGLGPASMTKGDIICVFFGGQVLYVLRDAKYDLYECIGECYVHGLMDGEVFRGDEVLQEQIFTII